MNRLEMSTFAQCTDGLLGLVRPGCSTRLVLVAAAVSALCSRGIAEEAVTYGRFSNPAPARNLVHPDIAAGPKYYIVQESPAIAEEIYWGSPGRSTGVATSSFMTYAHYPETDYIAVIVDASGALERDLSGNIVARGPIRSDTVASIGERFIMPEPDGEGGFTIPTQKLTENSNSLVFESKPVEYEYGVPLELGALTYHNHSSPLGTEITDVQFRLGFASLTVAEDQYFTDLAIKIVTTPNVADDPAMSADYIYFADYPEYGSFRVYEGETATVPLTGFINSLHFTGFGDSITGDGFLSPSVGVNPLSPVPDAGPGWLGAAMLLGLVGVSATRKHSRLESRPFSQ